MPGIEIDENGNVTGTIQLEDGDLLSGTHEIEILGSQGSVAKGVYVNNPALSIDDIRKIYATINDPISSMAQSFRVDEERDLIAIKVDLDVGDGEDDVVVQIREMENGLPSADKILAEGRRSASEIEDFGTYTRFALNPPAPLLTDREYCFTLQSNNVDYRVAVAEIGGIDSITGNVIANQPNSGVVFTSSNNSTWSVDQSKDLKFQLVAATYATTTREIDLGQVAGSNISDLLLLANTEISHQDSRVSFVVTDPELNTYILDKDKKFTLGSKKTGNFSVKAVLAGSSRKSPILYPNTELILGEINPTGVYNSKKFKVPDNFNIKVLVEAKAIASGNFVVAVENGVLGTFTDLTVAGFEVMVDGWVRYTLTASNIDEVGDLNLSSIRITQNSPSVASRIFLRNLIVFVE